VAVLWCVPFLDVQVEGLIAMRLLGNQYLQTPQYGNRKMQVALFIDLV